MGRRARKDDTGAAPAGDAVKPKNLRRGAGEKKPTKLESLERRVHHLFHEVEKLIMTAADLQSQVDALKQNVSDLQARVNAQKPLISQAQLDQNVADISAANDAIKAVAPPQA